jgi:hypothetical protein
MKLLVPALASLLMFGAAAHAADRGDADARLAQARELLRVTKTYAIQDLRIDLVVERAQVQFKQSMPGATDADAMAYGVILREELKRDVAKLTDMRALYYSTHFTLDELKEWTRMMQGPLGQKLTDAEPGLMRDLSNVDYVWLAAAMQRTQARYTAAHANGATHL